MAFFNDFSICCLGFCFFFLGIKYPLCIGDSIDHLFECFPAIWVCSLTGPTLLELLAWKRKLICIKSSSEDSDRVLKHFAPGTVRL